MLRVRNVLEWLEELAPFEFAEDWDHCGLQLGDPNAIVSKVLVALDVTSGTIDEAEKLECQCLVTHHPVIFKPLDTIRMDRYPGNLVLRAARGGLNLIAVHTCLDVARGGTNDRLADMIRLDSVRALETNDRFVGDDRYRGMGRFGFLDRPVPAAGFVEALAAMLGVEARVSGDPRKEVRGVAICTGSGGSLVGRAIASGADAYVTGDVKYHEARRAEESGMVLIDVGHFGSERIIVGPLAEYLSLKAQQDGVHANVFAAQEEREPFWSRWDGTIR